MDTSALHLKDFTKAVPKVRIMCHIDEKPISMVPDVARGYLSEQMRLHVQERLIL